MWRDPDNEPNGGLDSRLQTKFEGGLTILLALCLKGGHMLVYHENTDS